MTDISRLPLTGLTGSLVKKRESMERESVWEALSCARRVDHGYVIDLN
jgi:hypothetical protein